MYVKFRLKCNIKNFLSQYKQTVDIAVRNGYNSNINICLFYVLQV